MTKLLYGTGLRLMECVRLRVKDVDFEKNSIIIRDAKGMQDRITMLPESIKNLLLEHLQKTKLMHEHDLKIGYGKVYLPFALERKYPNANREWGVAVCFSFEELVQRSS